MDTRAEISRAVLAEQIARVATGAADDGEVPPASMLGRLVRSFGLTAFERDVLVLAAAAELEPALVVSMSCRCGRAHVCFADALERLSGGHWSALAPSAPLRRWSLVHVDAADTVRGSLRIDERTLFALLGVSCIDPVLQRLAGPAGVPDDADELPTVRTAADVAATRLTGSAPVLHISCDDLGVARRIARRAGAQLGLDVWEMDAAVLPATAEDLDTLAVVLDREIVLGDNLVLVTGGDDDSGTRRAVGRLIDRTSAPLVYAGNLHPTWQRRTEHLRPAPVSQLELTGLWRVLLGGDVLAGGTDGDADRRGDFTTDLSLPVEAVIAVAHQTIQDVERGESARVSVRRHARHVSRRELGALAERIDAPACWDDIVLPAQQLSALRGIAAHVRRRRTVETEWGFAIRFADSLAVSALFHGSSGVGKTLAARVLANDLELDLYRIELSQTVSKYIGETEKNLKRVFDAAEQTGAILLFDEADALFGKRSEVRDAHDRYANIEVSYLLQRMESYRGLAILTTNLPANLDAAFLRRLRYSVAFPFPDVVARRAIWERIFPAAAPTSGLDMAALSHLSVSGASIRNIALAAAVLAADEETPITMAHLLRAAQTEYAKHDRAISAAELQHWPRQLETVPAGGPR